MATDPTVCSMYYNHSWKQGFTELSYHTIYAEVIREKTIPRMVNANLVGNIGDNSKHSRIELFTRRQLSELLMLLNKVVR